MIFKEDLVPEFRSLFDEVQPKINAVNGCQGVELLQDKNQSNILFTYSYWDSEEALNAYRHSELFAETWKKTKALFDGKPEAWSVEKRQ